jgi:hypothetical protein
MASKIGGKSGKEGNSEQTKIYVLKNLGWVEVVNPVSLNCFRNFNPLICLKKLYHCIKDKLFGHVPHNN